MGDGVVWLFDELSSSGWDWREAGLSLRCQHTAGVRNYLNGRLVVPGRSDDQLVLRQAQDERCRCPYHPGPNGPGDPVGHRR